MSDLFRQRAELLRGAGDMDPEASAHGVPGPVGRGVQDTVVAVPTRSRIGTVSGAGGAQRTTGLGSSASAACRGIAVDDRPAGEVAGSNRSFTREHRTVPSSRTTCVLPRSWFPARSRAAYVSVVTPSCRTVTVARSAGDAGRRNERAAGRRIADARYSASAVHRPQGDRHRYAVPAGRVRGGAPGRRGQRRWIVAPLSGREDLRVLPAPRPPATRTGRRRAGSPCDRSGGSTSSRRSTRIRWRFVQLAGGVAVPGRPGVSAGDQHPPARQQGRGMDAAGAGEVAGTVQSPVAGSYSSVLAR